MELGAVGLQGGGRIRTQTPNDTKKAAPGSERGSLWEEFWKLTAFLSAVFFTCFLGTLFSTCGAVWNDFWKCFGRYLGALGF